MKTPTLRSGTYAISALSHVTALFAHATIYKVKPISLSSEYHVVLFISASFIIMLICILVKSYLSYIICMALRYFVAIFLVFQEGLHPAVGYCLLVSIVIELGMFEPYPRSVIAGFPLIVFFWIIALPTSSWMSLISYSWIGDSIVMMFVSFLVLFVVALVTYYRERCVEVTKDLHRMDQAVTRLTNAITGFQNYAMIAGDESRAKERRRITREIHDIVGYGLMNVGMMLEAARRLVQSDPEKLDALLSKAHELTNECFANSRIAMHSLREHMDPHVSGLSAIARLAKVFQQSTNTVVNMEYGNAAMSYGERIDFLLYRSVQEGLVNAYRHGQAARVDVFFAEYDNKLELRISDRGRGCTTLKKGIGLTGMEERVSEVGGQLFAGNNALGFELRLSLPLPPGRSL